MSYSVLLNDPLLIKQEQNGTEKLQVQDDDYDYMKLRWQMYT